MKTKIFIGFAISVILVVFFAGCATKVNNIVFKVKPDNAMLERAAKLKVYEIQPVREDRKTFDTYTKQLFQEGLKGDPIQVNDVISVSDMQKSSNFMMLELSTGYLSFNHGMSDQIDDKPGNLPNDNESIKIAQSFLQKNNMEPGNLKEMVPAHVGWIRSASFDPNTGNEGPVRDQMRIVYFSRNLDEVPVIGSGSKMIVRIGDNGEIVGGSRRWAEIDSGRELKLEELRSIKTIIGDIESFLKREMELTDKIEINNFILVYYDNGGKYIQPALAYEATITGKELKYSYLGQTALLQNPPERVGPEPVSVEAKKMLKTPSPKEKPPTTEKD